MSDKWIQKAHLKKDALRDQLGVPKDENIPKTFLDRIASADLGERVRNPTQIGVKEIKKTELVERRVNAAVNLRRLGR